MTVTDLPSLDHVTAGLATFQTGDSAATTASETRHDLWIGSEMSRGRQAILSGLLRSISGERSADGSGGTGRGGVADLWCCRRCSNTYTEPASDRDDTQACVAEAAQVIEDDRRRQPDRVPVIQAAARALNCRCYWHG